MISLAHTRRACSGRLRDEDDGAHGRSGGRAGNHSAQAIGQAVRAPGARRIALGSPYSPPVIERAKRDYETKYGLEVVAMEGSGATYSY